MGQDRGRVICGTLDPDSDWYHLFEKLDLLQDGVVWRAWLREYEVQLSAEETEESAAEKAFEFAFILRKHNVQTARGERQGG